MANEYTVIVPTGLAIPANMPIKLSDEQLARRRHQVRPHNLDGFWVSAERLNFKLGEKIVVEGELPKNLAALTDKPVAPSPPTPVSIDPGKPARTKSKK